MIKFGLQKRISDPKVKIPSAIKIIFFLPNLSEFGPDKNCKKKSNDSLLPVKIDPNIPPITAIDTTI